MDVDRGKENQAFYAVLLTETQLSIKGFTQTMKASLQNMIAVHQQQVPST